MPCGYSGDILSVDKSTLPYWTGTIKNMFVYALDDTVSRPVSVYRLVVQDFRLERPPNHVCVCMFMSSEHVPPSLLSSTLTCSPLLMVSSCLSASPVKSALHWYTTTFFVSARILKVYECVLVHFHHITCTYVIRPFGVVDTTSLNTSSLFPLRKKSLSCLWTVQGATSFISNSKCLMHTHAWIKLAGQPSTHLGASSWPG